jgi:hypothetical protein
MKLGKPALIAATAGLVLGGGSAAAIAATGNGSSTSAAKSAKAPTIEVPVTGTRGTGSLTVTGPKGKTRALKNVHVACAATGGTYVVREDVTRGRSVRGITLVVPGYRGAGSYNATAVMHRQAGKQGAGKALQVPVTLTSDGGSATVTKTLSGKKDSSLKGKTVKLSASWTCTA